ncbi:hypothetical protein FRB90_000029 [Tulasnella sp. 427]|nr:hypothetical protein FRB90_000029 [Tulasnella sp. 427]
MSSSTTDISHQDKWNPSDWPTLKDEVRALRYYVRRNDDSMGRRIAKGGGDPRASRENISMEDIRRRYEELERSESGKKLIKEVIAEEEAMEATKPKLLQG